MESGLFEARFRQGLIRKQLYKRPTLRSLVFLVLVFLASPTLAQALTPGWIVDLENGCKVWNLSPKANETISWSGACKNGFAQGPGVVQWYLSGKLGDRFEGEWKDGKQNGRGLIAFDNGDRYEGQWKDGTQHGRGLLTLDNGDRYEGLWKEGKPDGTGTYVGGAEKYSGRWTNGCFRQGGRAMALRVTAKECGFK